MLKKILVLLLFNILAFNNVNLINADVSNPLPVDPSTISHSGLADIGNDDHTQHPLLLGRSGGQVLIGGIDANDDLTFETTSNASKGSYFLSNLISNGFVKTSGNNGLLTTSSTIAVDEGGTGQTSYTNGQILIGNTTGNTVNKTTLTGTVNQVIVTNGAGSITLSTSQDIHTGASPSFLGLTVGALEGVLKASTGAISGSATTSDMPEGANLYYTDARARASNSAGDGIDYNSTSGQIDADINTTNLKITTTEINTIQDITTTSNLQFAKLGLGAAPVEVFDIAVGNILSEGTHGAGDIISASGSGTRFIWYPRKSSFRVGAVDGTQWDDSNIGNYSFVTGKNNSALTDGASSFGGSLAGNEAGGIDSIASGSGTMTSGNSSFSTGNGTIADGNNSIAGGQTSSASGANSFAMGFFVGATGDHTASFGFNSRADAYASMVAGRYNILGGNATSWVATDQLFVLGNGGSAISRSNAFAVFKDGTAEIQTSLAIGTTSPAASTILDLSSTTGALKITGMTTTQRNALTPSPAMIIYNSTDDKFQGRISGSWVDLS